MSIHVTRAPTVPLTSYDTKRRSHLKPYNSLLNEYAKNFKLSPRATMSQLYLTFG